MFTILNVNCICYEKGQDKTVFVTKNFWSQSGSLFVTENFWSQSGSLFVTKNFWSQSDFLRNLCGVIWTILA